TLVFMWQGLVDYKLGLVLGLTMFVGAYVGAHYASKMNEIWLRRIFLTTVLLLAAKAAWDLV
ncbi:MAG TPA: sulfite exporter TauE/SafE family protein, partial [Pyrinomonadaceae bacterium]|nr:sulfite exporter TauE/SafE family protein [Pyrinomonadaceae bacterium]